MKTDRELKQQHRAARQAHRESKRNPSVTASQSTMIDCACVIHGTGYDWEYVERLYYMLTRQLPGGIRFHVYTEHDRSVPPHMIKHILDDWGIGGPKKSWWYKMQLFNPAHFSGRMLYLDLDVVVVQNLEWITALPTDYFWTIRDFRYLQNPRLNSMNSSVMWFDVDRFSWVWDKFNSGPVLQKIQGFPGDQDFLNATIDHNQRRFFDDCKFQSYRWQCLDGGYNFNRRSHHRPGSGTVIAPDTSVVVFHGKPKPHQITDPAVREHWR
jgi:hypothetical protein